MATAATVIEESARLVRPGGHIANIGVHGSPVSLHLEDLWIRDVTIITGLVDSPVPDRLTRTFIPFVRDSVIGGPVR